MTFDPDRVDDAALALLTLFSFEDGRAWKGFDFDVLDRFHAKGLITNPKGKAKSLWLTPEGMQRGRDCAARLFGAGV